MDETDVFVDVHKRILVARAKCGRRQSFSTCEGTASTSRQAAARRHIIRRAKSNQSDNQIQVSRVSCGVKIDCGSMYPFEGWGVKQLKRIRKHFYAQTETPGEAFIQTEVSNMTTTQF